jgi:hypothetical protein
MVNYGHSLVKLLNEFLHHQRSNHLQAVTRQVHCLVGPAFGSLWCLDLTS